MKGEKSIIKVKICGVTNLEDARRACAFGADLLGFIFVGNTPRAVCKETARKVILGLEETARRGAGMVGLFKDAEKEEVAEAVSYCGFDFVQLHGSETPSYCAELKEMLGSHGGREVRIMKVFKVDEEILPAGGHVHGDYPDVDHFVFDTFHPDLAGGTGGVFNWEVIARERDKLKKPFFIAGGLSPENVVAAVKATRPYGVDVSSGVESSPGKKDEDLLKEFITNAKKAYITG